MLRPSFTRMVEQLLAVDSQPAGLSAGDTAFHGAQGLVWLVVISQGERIVRAETTSQTEAWQEALRMAELEPVLNGRADRHRPK